MRREDRKLQPPRLRRQQVIRESQVVRGELRGNHSAEDNLTGVDQFLEV